MKNILMVCLGNICRSPMAEGWLAHYAKQHGLAWQVQSAGISAMLGHPADSNAIATMQQYGIDISQHQPTQLTLGILHQVDLVLVMEKWQQKHIGCHYPSAYGKVHCLGKWSDFEVADPYRQTIAAFETCYQSIEKGLQDWLQYLGE